MLGAHGMREKNIFYEESAHIPLLISSPGQIDPQKTVDGYVSLIDLYPTILDYLEMPEHESDGKSLRGLIEGTDTVHGKYVVTEWDSNGDNTPNYMVVKDGWKLIIPYTITSNVLNAMYDLNTDPYEMDNLLGSNSDSEQYKEKAEELRACLVEWLTERNSIHTYSVSKRDLIAGGKPTGNGAEFVAQEIPELNPGAAVNVSITMKNTGTTAWTNTANIKLGSIAPVNNFTWGLNRVSLNEGDSILPGEEKIFAFEITVPDNDGIFVFQWQMVQEGEEWFGAKSEIKQVVFGNPGRYLDDCDAITDWNSSSGLVLNTSDQQQGSGCLEFSAASTDEYKKSFSTPFNAHGSVENTELKFWYYVSDVSLFETANQVELGSGGGPDNDEFNWSLNNLTNGWNLVSLKTSEANTIGSPNLSAINWFRIYHKKTGTITTRLDAIQLYDPTADPMYTLLVNNGSGGGTYFEGDEVNIIAHSAPSGQMFDTWVIESGEPTIAELTASNTTLTMGSGNAIIAATYKETQNYSVIVNNGSGSGDYTPGAIVVVDADPAPENKVFKIWEINAGNISLSNAEADLTYFTMPEEDVELTATYKDVVGIEGADQLENKHQIQLYPNPTKNKFTVSLSVDKETNVDLSITDLNGKTIENGHFNGKLEVGDHQINVGVNKVKPGAYIVRLTIEESVYTETLIIN